MQILPGGTATPPGSPSWPALGIVYVIAYLVQMLSLRFAPASTVAPFYNLEPVVTTGIAAAFLGERLQVNQYAGGGTGACRSRRLQPHRKMEEIAAMTETPIPVAVLTGFLGAGKTTLLNFLLKDPLLANAAVIINEFGDVGIDHLLVEKSDENVIELSSGCLCCTIRGDLIDTIHDLLARRGRGEIKAL